MSEAPKTKETLTEQMPRVMRANILHAETIDDFLNVANPGNLPPGPNKLPSRFVDVYTQLKTLREDSSRGISEALIHDIGKIEDPDIQKVITDLIRNTLVTQTASQTETAGSQVPATTDAPSQTNSTLDKTFSSLESRPRLVAEQTPTDHLETKRPYPSPQNEEVSLDVAIKKQREMAHAVSSKIEQSVNIYDLQNKFRLTLREQTELKNNPDSSLLGKNINYLSIKALIAEIEEVKETKKSNGMPARVLSFFTRQEKKIVTSGIIDRLSRITGSGKLKKTAREHTITELETVGISTDFLKN
ncbi:MAG: hypothetical protein ACI9VM_000540 [Candidatus Azotimanducaceae bacterium]|jgi:hypothetical protein